MVSFSILSKRFCLKRKGLSDSGVVSVVKKNMAVHSWQIFIKFLKSIPDE